MERKRSGATIALVVLLAVGLLGFGAVAAGAVDVQPGGQRIQLTGQVTASNVDAETGHSRGDVLVFTDDLFDEDGAHVGRSVAQAVVTSEKLTLDPPAGDMLCTLAITLDEGQIALIGNGDIATIFAGEQYSVPIVGGSGAFSKARGEAVYGNFDPETGAYELTLVLR